MATTSAAAPAPTPSAQAPQVHADPGAEHAHQDLVGVSVDQLERSADPKVGLRPATGPAAREAATAAALGPEVSGSWGPVTPSAVVPVFTALLPNGKVLMWDSVGDNATESYPDQSFTRAAVWDPATGASTRIDVAGSNIFCAGFVQLSDGRIFVAGGNKDQQLAGIKLTHIFDWETMSWIQGPDMTGERWYPSVAALMDGQALIVAGGPTIAEIRATDGSIRQLPGITAPSSRAYPFLQSSTDGRVLNAGPANSIFRLNWWGSGSLEAGLGRDGLSRDYGSYATFAPGLTLVTGGGSESVGGVARPYASSTLIDTRSGGIQTTSMAPMANRRRQHNLTILADGSMLATGGMSATGDGLINLTNPVYAAERYVPATNTWTTLSSAAVIRQYHSTAMLLPDGRVLTGGGGICGSCQSQGYLRKDIEVFSPPYLFDASGGLATRPLVSNAPGEVTLDRPFNLTSPDAANISKLALIRFGAPTHSQDQGQRYVPLTFSTSGTTLTVNAPPNPAEAPPGYYLLFVVNDAGVPSVAPIVHVAAPPAGSYHGSGTRAGGPAAIAYSGANAAGSSQVLEPGTWQASRGNLGYVGNDQISSIDIADGWSATVCTDDAMTQCTTLLPSPATSLPVGFDNAISAIRLQPSNGDTVAPAAPTGLSANGGTGRVDLAWSAATDDTGVTSYAVHRSTSPGFTPTAGTLVADVNTTSFADTALSPGTYYYRVTARDAAGNISTPSDQAAATVTTDATAPTAVLTSPSAGATVSATTTVTANASDNVAVAAVQFTLDGSALGSADSTLPYQVSWDTTSATNGTHTLAAVATDTSGNSATSAQLSVTVKNAAPLPAGLVGAWSFNAGSGGTAVDASGRGNTGTLVGPTWTTAGKFGGALTFDGSNDRVDVLDTPSLDLTQAVTIEAWVLPVTSSGWGSLVVKERAGGPAYSLYARDGSGRPASYLRLKSELGLTAPAALPVDTWSHVATTYDGARHRLYVNGVQVASVARNGKIGTSARSLSIGGNSAFSEWFSGRIDEVRVYGRALTAAEITTDRGTPLP